MEKRRQTVTRFFGEVVFRSTLLEGLKHYWHLSLRAGSTIPSGPCLIYGNHSNNFDAFLINAFIGWGDNTAGLMTTEYMHQHVLAPFFKSFGLLPTRKHVPEPHLIRKIFRLLHEDRIVVIYPEGGRRWDGRPAPWIESTAKLFSRAGVPVYPIHTHGSYVAWPRWARYPRPAHIELEVLPPIPVDRHTPFEEALRMLKAPIQFDENVVDEHIRPTKAYQPAVGLNKLLYRDPFTGESGGVTTYDGDRVTSISGQLEGRVLPDSRIVLDSTGEVLLTGDLYQLIRKLPYTYREDRPIFSVRADVSGDLNGEILRLRDAEVSFYATHLFIEGTKKYHVPIESIFYTGTERNKKLILTHSSGLLTLIFHRGGSVLQWYDELLRSAPNIRN